MVLGPESRDRQRSSLRAGARAWAAVSTSTVPRKMPRGFWLGGRATRRFSPGVTRRRLATSVVVTVGAWAVAAKGASGGSPLVGAGIPMVPGAVVMGPTLARGPFGPAAPLRGDDDAGVDTGVGDREGDRTGMRKLKIFQYSATRRRSRAWDVGEMPTGRSTRPRRTTTTAPLENLMTTTISTDSPLSTRCSIHPARPRGPRLGASLRQLRRLATAALAATALSATSGCYTYLVKVGNGGDISRAPTHSEQAHHYLSGALGEGALDIQKVCKSGDATVRISQTMVDVLLQWALGGALWQPSTMEVFCGDGAVALIDVDEEDAAAIVASDDFLEAVVALAPERAPEASALNAAQRSR